MDGSSYLFRAFHALPDFSTADGFPTGAIFGVINMLRKLGRDFEGSPVAVVFDAPGKSFRNDIYPEYKANRPRMADELRQQIAPIHDIIRALGMPLLIVPGVEADDVIGTLAAQATVARRHTVVSTSDKDMAQLVSDYVTLVNTMSETTLDRGGVIGKYGVPPERIIDYLALMGDSVDNIPGVPLVGGKTAAQWIERFESLDGVMASADQVKGKRGENLRAMLDQLPVSRELATIRCDVELPVALEDLTPEPADVEALVELFSRFEFKSWIADLGVEEEAPPPAARDYVVVTELPELEAWGGRLRAAEVLALAVHTDRAHYMDARIAGFSFAIDLGVAAYVPVGHDLAGSAQVSLASALEIIGPVLEDPAVRKVGHNLKLARNVLARHGVALAGIAFDPMLESYVLDSVGTRRHSLEAMATKHLGMETTRYEDIAGKGAKQLDFPALAVDAATDYAAEGADVALRLHGVLWPRLESTGRLRDVYEEIEIPVLSVLSRVEQAGALVDAGLLAEQGRELAQRVETLAEEAYRSAGHPFNLGSPKQLQEVLYDEMGLTPRRKTQTGQRSTAEAVLQELANEGNELPRIILDHRQLAKLKSTYTDTLPQQINQRTGRIHTTYGQAVAATGRLASQDPNLQNIPIRTEEGRRIRQAFVAPPGRKLVAADYSQIELRIMAHLSRDEGLVRAISGGLDVHRATAAEVFGVGVDEVSGDQRRSAKAINFGLIYGMSAFGLARQLRVSRKEAQGYVDMYFARYPDVRAYMDRTRAQAAEEGFVETVYGRRLYLPEINARQPARRQAAERTAINAPMQGTAADIIKRAMIDVDAWLTSADCDASMIMQVHDELVFEVAEGAVETLIENVTERMTRAADLSVDLVVDIGVGDNWDEAH